MAIPVTIEDARRQVRLDADDASLDADLTGFIADAAAWVENYTGQILTARDVTENFVGFGAVALKAWPIRADAAPGVAYLNSAGTPVSVTGARLDVSKRPARVLPPNGPFYSFLDSKQAFTVTIRAGYDDGDVVPGNMRRAMLILISAMETDRAGGEIFQKAESAARKLCFSCRQHTL
jgi:uncharacterized phiE125 gp8 family phage protein